MSEYFSDQYVSGAAAVAALAQDGTTPKISATRQYAPLRFARAVVNRLAPTDPVRDGDTLRLFPMKSGDVPVRMYCNSRAAWDASFACDIGIALAGANHDGALIHASAVDLLASAVDIGSTLDREAILGNAAGTTARAYGHFFPETEVDGVEIDAELT